MASPTTVCDRVIGLAVPNTARRPTSAVSSSSPRGCFPRIRASPTTISVRVVTGGDTTRRPAAVVSASSPRVRFSWLQASPVTIFLGLLTDGGEDSPLVTPSDTDAGAMPEAPDTTDSPASRTGKPSAAGVATGAAAGKDAATRATASAAAVPSSRASPSDISKGGAVSSPSPRGPFSWLRASPGTIFLDVVTGGDEDSPLVTPSDTDTDAIPEATDTTDSPASRTGKPSAASVATGAATGKDAATGATASAAAVPSPRASSIIISGGASTGDGEDFSAASITTGAASAATVPSPRISSITPSVGSSTGGGEDTPAANVTADAAADATAGTIAGATTRSATSATARAPTSEPAPRLTGNAPPHTVADVDGMKGRTAQSTVSCSTYPSPMSTDVPFNTHLCTFRSCSTRRTRERIAASPSARHCSAVIPKILSAWDPKAVSQIGCGFTRELEATTSTPILGNTASTNAARTRSTGMGSGTGPHFLHRPPGTSSFLHIFV